MGLEKLEINDMYYKNYSQGFAGLYIKMEAITTARTCHRMLIQM